MTELLSRSIRLTREGSPRLAARALIDELWREAGDVEVADRSAVERAVDTMISAVFPEGELDGAAVCSLLMSVRDDRLEVIAAAAAQAPQDEPVTPGGGGGSFPPPRPRRPGAREESRIDHGVGARARPGPRTFVRGAHRDGRDHGRCAG